MREEYIYEKKLSESSFTALRLPFESGRQTPGNMSIALFLFVLIQALLIYMEYHFAAFSHFPKKYEILSVHLRITVILAVLSVVYCIPFIYKRSQKVQYMIIILTSQNVASVSPLLLALLLMGEREVGSVFLILFTKVVLIIGMLVFIATSVRFYILLKKGAYERNSKKDIERIFMEKNMKALIPVLVTSGTGLSLIITFLSRNVRISPEE
ncbi:hypothetical protein P9232_06950 [Weizmannia sp. CD-2023]|uniref:hypothetical protein n=1 Tax=Heyndrickxia TaxID=2837504 RepID=UPI002E1D9E75|nr:hypothetical protein [Weizmannia sp. CD-2023]